jgi:hypothetical protein
MKNLKEEIVRINTLLESNIGDILSKTILSKAEQNGIDKSKIAGILIPQYLTFTILIKH